MSGLAMLSLALLILTLWLGSEGYLDDPAPPIKVERPIVVPCGPGGSVGVPQMTR